MKPLWAADSIRICITDLHKPLGLQADCGFRFFFFFKICILLELKSEAWSSPDEGQKKVTVSFLGSYLIPREARAVLSIFRMSRLQLYLQRQALI